MFRRDRRWGSSATVTQLRPASINKSECSTDTPDAFECQSHPSGTSSPTGLYTIGSRTQTLEVGFLPQPQGGHTGVAAAATPHYAPCIFVQRRLTKRVVLLIAFKSDVDDLIKMKAPELKRKIANLQRTLKSIQGK